jgi:hypothetical protein
MTPIGDAPVVAYGGPDLVRFSAEQITLLSGAGLVAIAGVAYLCARKSGYHRGKHDVYREYVYREFAETFGAMTQSAWIRDKTKRKRETKRHWMRLIMCEHWNRTPDENPGDSVRPERVT